MPNPIVQGHPADGDWAHKVRTEDLVRSLLVQLIGGYGSGFPGCKWGWDLSIPTFFSHRGRRIEWRPRHTYKESTRKRGGRRTYDVHIQPASANHHYSEDEYNEDHDDQQSFEPLEDDLRRKPRRKFIYPVLTQNKYYVSREFLEEIRTPSKIQNNEVTSMQELIE